MTNSIALCVCLGILSGTVRGAGVDDVRSFFQTILTEKDDNNLPKSPDIPDMIDGAVRNAPVTQVQSLLPLGVQCLQSAKFAVRAHGVLLFKMIALRPDSPMLIDPYIDVLTPLLTDPNVGIRYGAIYVLSRTKPPRVYEYITTHLLNSKDAAQYAGVLAIPMLESGDPDNVRNVLDLAEQRPDLAMKGVVIRTLGLLKNTSEQSLKMIHGGLNDANPGTRRTSVDALDHMPREIRTQFAPELQRLALDQDPAIRARATEVLTSAKP
jgi:hypothetical protein